jgi:hypothetical protein
VRRPMAALFADSKFDCARGLLALLAAATLALAPASALAIGGEQKLDDPPTMGYTTMRVTGLVKADLTSFTGAVVEIADSPSGLNDGALGGGGELPLFPGEEVAPVDKTFTDLEPGTTYYARIKGEKFDGDGPTFSNVVSGTTLPVDAPAVLGVDGASSVSFTTAHVGGEVEGAEGPDPAFASHCRFEYVTDAEYGARDEVQVLTVRATGGTFQVGYEGSSTGPIAYDASAATLEAALEVLPAIGAGNVAVSGGPGNPGGDNPYTVSFQGALAGADLGQMYAESSGLEPGGQSGADVQTAVGGHPVEGFNRASSTPCDVNPVTAAGPTSVSADLTGLEAGTTYHLRLAISNAGGGDSEEASNFTTLAVDPPAVLGVDDADNVLYTQADLSGEVERPVGADPAFDVDCRFEYVTASSFLSEGFQSAGQQPCAETPVTGPGASAVSAHLSGLSIGTTYYYRLVAVNAGGRDVLRGANPFTTLVPDAPEVSIFPVEEIGAHTARFSGEINPGNTDPGFDVNWHFECTPECPGLEGSIPADEADHEVSVEAKGLSANTAYQVSLVASNASQSASAGPVGFSTDAAAPRVGTFPAFAMAGGTEAFVGGTVDAENSTSTYWIEYGTDGSYGSSIPLGEDGDAGSGEETAFYRERLTGLQPGAEYHYRLVAENQAGTAEGRDMTFVTPTGDLGSSIGAVDLPDDRTWEMVSPPQKNSADIWRVYLGASADGKAISYKSQGSFAGLPTAKGATLADYIARRGSTGWTSEGLTPGGGLYSFTSGAFEMSDDRRFTRFNWRERGNESPDREVELDPDQIGSVVRQYLRNNDTKKFKRIPFPVEALPGEPKVGLPYAGTPDNSHYAVTTLENVTDESPCYTEAAPCVYESLDHGFSWRLASVLPDESPAHGSLAGISQDGSRIYFRSGEGNYVRVGGSTTTQISGGGGTSVLAIEGGTGSRVLLRSSEPLLGSDEDSADDLYLWDGSQPDGERLTLVSQGDRPGVEIELDRALGYQEDMVNTQRVERGFFVGGNQLLAGEDETPGQKIYAWDATGGQPSLSYVATANPSDARTSPNGRFLVFTSAERLTAYDNAGQQEVYRYDQDTDRLVCVSCEPEGRAATAEGRLYYIADPESAFGIGHALRNVTDEGLVFFESLERLAKHDSNGEADVYEYSEGLPHLLSKGTGAHQSRFADASISGDDVFILTDDQLSGWDTDRSYDVYDARVGGGLPEPPAGVIPCEGDSCQPNPSPPNDPTPASEGFKGAGNVKPQAAKKPCKKAKGKKRCQKKKHKKHGEKKSTGKNG